MTRIRRLMAATAVALLSVPALTLGAGASSAVTSDAATGEYEVVEGGTVQHTDPTRYDYVPLSASPTDLVQPASASGLTLLSAFKYTWNGISIPVPGLQWHYHLTGSGLNVTNQHSRWVPTLINNVRLCNWKVQYQNRTGSTIHSTFTTGTHTGCTWGTGTDTLTNDYRVKTGIQCARLFVQGYFRGEHCHAVY